MTGIDKIRRFGRVEDMMRFIKKWWLLEHLNEQILLHSSSQRKVLLSQRFFIEGSKEYPGLVCRAPNIFSVFRWGRKLEKLRELDEIRNTPNFKRRMREYNDIFDVCVKEGYIEMVPAEKGILMPTTATPFADEINGSFGLLQALLKRYWLAWSVIIFPLTIGIWGSPLFRYLLNSLWEKIWSF